MNDYIAELTLDLDCRNILPTVRAGQYDNGRKCLIHITANDQPYSATGCTAVVKGRRQDKTFFSASCSINNSGDVVLTLSESILAVRGFAYAKIVLSDATRTYSTQLFILDVDSGLEGITSETNSFSILNDCISRLLSLGQSIDEINRNFPIESESIEDGAITADKIAPGVIPSDIDISGKVDKTRMIAGVDLQDDITVLELQTALSVPTKTSDLTNDSGFLTAHQDISGKADIEDLPEDLGDFRNAAGYIKKYEASGEPPSSPTATRYDVPCLWMYNGRIWYVYKATQSGSGGVSLFTYSKVEIILQHQDISGKENTSNKTSAITNANKASETLYPNIKAVVDYVDTVIGGIENGSY